MDGRVLTLSMPTDPLRARGRSGGPVDPTLPITVSVRTSLGWASDGPIGALEPVVTGDAAPDGGGMRPFAWAGPAEPTAVSNALSAGRRRIGGASRGAAARRVRLGRAVASPRGAAAGRPGGVGALRGVPGCGVAQLGSLTGVGRSWPSPWWWLASCWPGVTRGRGRPRERPRARPPRSRSGLRPSAPRSPGWRPTASVRCGRPGPACRDLIRPPGSCGTTRPTMTWPSRRSGRRSPRSAAGSGCSNPDGCAGSTASGSRPRCPPRWTSASWWRAGTAPCSGPPATPAVGPPASTGGDGRVAAVRGPHPWRSGSLSLLGGGPVGRTVVPAVQWFGAGDALVHWDGGAWPLHGQRCPSGWRRWPWPPRVGSGRPRKARWSGSHGGGRP